MTFQHFFLIFLIYSFVGTVAQVIYLIVLNDFIYKKSGLKEEARNFLHLPITPIYGFGSLLFILISTLIPADTPLFFTFLYFVVGATLLELSTGELLRAVYGKNIWWDYSHKRFNFRGQVCLPNVVFFGVGGLFIAYLVNPMVIRALNFLPPDILHLTFIAALILVLLDSVYSLFTSWRSTHHS